MPRRPPTLAQRLRSAWTQATALRTTGAERSQAGHSPSQASDFADRLRAAVAARH